MNRTRKVGNKKARAAAKGRILKNKDRRHIRQGHNSRKRRLARSRGSLNSRETIRAMKASLPIKLKAYHEQSK